MRQLVGCLFLALLVPVVTQAQNVINTIAGGGSPLSGVNPLTASLGGAGAVVGDAVGNVYFTSPDGGYVFQVNAQGQISILAGTGFSGYGISGSGPATNAAFVFPWSVALDASGSNLFITDGFGNHVFEVNLATHAITNFAGSTDANNPLGGFGGDTGPATQALLNEPLGVAVSGGTVYIADAANNRVRAVTGGVISTFAGTGTACSDPTSACGDGGPASQATLSGPSGVAVDASGNIYITDTFDNKIREVAAGGTTISTIAGTGNPCGALPCGDGGPATLATLTQPSATFVDNLGNLYIVDEGDFEIRAMVPSDPAVPISTVAGNGTFGFTADNAPATSSLDDPTGGFVDSLGNIIFSERGSNRIRVDTDGILGTLAGGGTEGDGGPALSAVFADVDNIALDGAGNLYVAEGGTSRVRKVAAGGTGVTTVAGNGTAGFGGDDGAATNAILNVPFGVAIDPTSGNIFIADNGNNDIRRVQNGVISTYAGSAFASCSPPTGGCGDGQLAIDALFNRPQSLALDTKGNLLIADVADNRIREINNQTGIINTVAGTGNTCPPNTNCGDGSAATAASLTAPSGVAVDSAGNIFIADSGDNRVRRVDAVTGIITTVAFNGQASFSGDGGPATLASMTGLGRIAVDSAGNLFLGGVATDQVAVADSVVRRVDAATGTVATVAGNAAQPLAIGFSGDGGPATSATLANAAVAVSGNVLYIGDVINHRVRSVQLSATSTPSPTTVDFGNQMVGVASSPQQVTLTNSGGDDLLISSIADANGFSQTNNCPLAPKPLAPAQSCTINIIFTGTAPGAATDTLIITDNAPGSPHNIPLSATGTAPFQLTSNCTSLSVVPGQSAIYTVSLTPAQGFTKSVSLACSGAPALATCTVSPTNVTLDGATTVQATVTATTTPATADLRFPADPANPNRLAGLIGLAGMAGLAGLVVVPGNRRAKQARKLWVVLFCLCMISTTATVSSCGGGLPPDPPGTAAGTYPLTVTATFQSGSGTAFTEKVSFDLVVQ